MKILNLPKNKFKFWQSHLHELEQSITYPYGEDSFSISHGDDYFAFFARLGKPVCYLAVEQGRIAGVGIGVLRSGVYGGKKASYWYLCDLKVQQDFRGHNLSRKIFSKAFLWNYLRCGRGYAICMNPSGDKPNPVVAILQKFPWTPLKVAGKLQIYSLSYEQALKVEKLIKTHRGELCYLSLKDKKDLVLQSTGEPLKLLHMQFGPHAEQGVQNPMKGYTHMFCALENSPLDFAMHEQNILPSASATLLHHNMKNFDWDQILTSDL